MARLVLVWTASPGRDQRRECQVEFARGDGGQVRVDLGVLGQAGREQFAVHLSDGRRLQPVAGQPADRESARRGDIDQAGRTQRPRQCPAVAQVRAAAGQQFADRVAQPVGPLLRGAAVVQAGQWLQSGYRRPVGYMDSVFRRRRQLSAGDVGPGDCPGVR